MDEIIRPTCVLAANKSCFPYPFQTHLNRHGRFIGQHTNRKTHSTIRSRLLMTKPVIIDSSKGLATVQAAIGFLTLLWP